MKNLSKILTKEFLEKEYIIAKKTTYEIAKEINCSQPTVYNYLIKNNKKIRTGSESHGINPDFLTKDFLYKEYIIKNQSTTQIAKQIGCNWSTVYRKLIKCNIPIKTQSQAMKGKYKGKNSPSWKENKAIDQKHYCIELNCKNEICYNNWKDGQGRCPFHNYKRKRELGLYNPPTGKYHWKWKQDKSSDSYPIAWTEILKESIRIRDNYQCQICGKSTKENIRALDIHHIDYDKENLDPKNLISLCKSCHMESNYNREIYIEYFKILKEKINV